MRNAAHRHEAGLRQQAPKLVETINGQRMAAGIEADDGKGFQHCGDVLARILAVCDRHAGIEPRLGAERLRVERAQDHDGLALGRDEASAVTVERGLVAREVRQDLGVIEQHDLRGSFAHRRTQAIEASGKFFRRKNHP